MRRRRIRLAAIVVLTTTATPAAAQYYARPVPVDSGFIVFCVVVAGLAGTVYAIYKAFFELPSPPPPPPTPEEYDQESARLRAKARMLAAEAEYEDNRAKAALKKHEAHEVDQFVRGLRAKHGRR